MALVFTRHREAAVAGVAPPGGPTLGGSVALAAREVVVIAEVFAGDAAEVVDRELADCVLLVKEAFDQPLDAVLATRCLVPAAPFLFGRAEVLRGERDERFACEVTAAIGALDDADEIGDRVGVAELDDGGSRGAYDFGIVGVHGAARTHEGVAEIVDGVTGERFDRARADAEVLVEETFRERVDRVTWAQLGAADGRV